MRIFISYSSKYRDLCERLQLALEANGRHEVFVDRSELTPGQPFDQTLRDGIHHCDLLLFLMSPESVAPGSYALAELSIAKQRWRHPGGRVLPVKVAPTPKEAIPAYLRAVTILEPLGDVVAETVAAVEAVRPPARRWRVWALIVTAVVVAGGLAAAGYGQLQARRAGDARVAEQQRVARAQEQQAQRAQLAQAQAQAQAAEQQRTEDAQVATLVATARQLCNAGDHALGWQRFDEAPARQADRPDVRQAREDCGMRWLREIHVVSGKGSFTDIVNRVLPSLAQGAVSASGQRAGDLLAHLGWADFLREREGAARLDPPAHYRKALAADPGNVFAHAMWAHHLLTRREPLTEATTHFNAALASGRERAYVRSLQFAALLYHQQPEAMAEAALVANDMRKNSEDITPEVRQRLWTYAYQDNLLHRDRREAFLARLHAGSPAADAVATFAWLYPQARVRDDRHALWSYFMATLEAAAGNKASARSRFEALRDELKRERSSGRLLDETMAALKRLQGP